MNRPQSLLPESGWALFVDDERHPALTDEQAWGDRMRIARSSDQAIALMHQLGAPSWLSLDHDLGGEDTAMSVVDWMIERDLDEDGRFLVQDMEWDVHSQNSVGAKNLEGKLGGYLRWKDDKSAK